MIGSIRFVLSMVLLATDPVNVGLPEDPVVILEDPLGFEMPMLPGAFIGWTEGQPDLPVWPAWIELEENSAAVGIEVVQERWADMPGIRTVRPLPEPCIPSVPQSASVTEPGPCFLFDRFWPESPVELAGSGFRGGTPCAELIVHPLRWNPVSGEMQRLVDLEVSVETRPSSRAHSRGGRDADERMVIITDDEILAPMQALAEWRTTAGIPTEVVTTGEVYAWPGRDDPERIRNYIIDRVASDGIDYVLLGGDTKYVPCRYAFALSYETGGGRDDSLPCDLYYSDLDGSWNLDGDDIWGEVADSVDLYPDVLVGRAPVESLDEAWAFVNKIQAYETASITEHVNRALLIGAVMWQNPFTDGGVLCDYLDEHFIPDFYDVEKQYESQGYYGAGLAVAAMCMGTNFLDITAHGWITVAGCLGIPDVDSVNSYGRYFGMAASDGCWTAAFDFDAIAEHFVTNPQGCGVSYIGNSSYGWGSPGNPLYGYSDRMTIALFDELFEDPSSSLGEVIAGAKTGFVPFSREANTYRCLQYMVNLLGDPSLVPYRMTPLGPSIDLPGMVTPATTEVPVTVSAPGISVEGARVCIHDADCSLYEVAELDASGHAIVPLSQPPSGDLALTVTGTHLRRTTVALPYGTGPSLVLSSVVIDEPSGSGHLIPGAPAGVQLTLHNQGTVDLTGIELLAVLESGPATIDLSTISYGGLSPGMSGSGSNPLALSIDQYAQTGEIVQLQLEISCDQGSWSFSLPLLVYAPGLYFSTYEVDDSVGGNGNGYPEAGETFDLMVDIANLGLLDAGDIWVYLQTQPSYIDWIADEYTIPQIMPDSTGTAFFSGSVDISAPEFDFPEVFFEIYCQNLWYSLDSLILVIGDAGLSEDVESGPGGWTHSGAGDLWHISTSASHSTSHSWYCGSEPGMSYNPGMNCGLFSPEIVLAPAAELTFWSRFDLALYGADGLYVLLDRTGSLEPDTLDFIGAGGLLGAGGFLPFNENFNWLPRTYDLSGLCEPGTQARIELWFYSDTDGQVGGGFWLDDISVTGTCVGPGGTEEPPAPGTLSAGLPFPNPCSSSACIEVAVGTGPWAAAVFDMAGRMVLSEEHAEPWSGVIEIEVDRMPPGIYIIAVDSPVGCVSRRMVVLR